MKIGTYGWVVTGVSLIATSAALAQSEEPVDLGVIRIETDAAQGLLGNAEITDEDLEARDPDSLKEVFDGETAVTASGGAAIGQKVFVHGVEESLLAVTIDGARQNKSAFHHTGNVLIDPFMLKSVNISSGLAPADAGPGALAGTLAYETKNARDLLDEGDNFGGYATLTWGTNGQGWRSGLNLFGRAGGFEWVVGGSLALGEDYDDGDGTRVRGTAPEVFNGLAKVAYTSDSGHRLSFSASQTEDRGDRTGQAGPGGIIVLRPDFGGLVGNPNELFEGLSRRRSLTLTYTDEQPTGWFAPTAQLTYNEQEIDVVGLYGVNKSFSGKFENEFQLGNGTVNAGIDFFRETARGEGRGPGPFGSTGKESLFNVGLYAQARQNLNDRISVSYGARYDFQNFKGADDSTFTKGGFSANGAVDVVLSDMLTLTAGAASVWGGYELGEAALINFGTPWNYAGFVPSRSNSARLGLRFDHGGLQVGAALFYTEINDIAAVLPVTPGARGQTVDLTTKGIDASVRYDWDNAFAKLNYTYADVTVDGKTITSTAYYLGRPTGHLFALEGGWDVNQSWRVGGIAQIALKNDKTAGLSVGRLGAMGPLPAYQVVDLYAEYVPEALPNMKVRFAADNIFNETYASRSSDGIGLPGIIPANEPGRQFSITASMKF